MNHLKTMVVENLEANKYITHMDLRDNQLADLDLSSLCNLEQLHCERNQLRELTLSGFSLRTLYAGSNSEFSIQPTVLTSCLSWQSFLTTVASVLFLALLQSIWDSLSPSFILETADSTTSVVEIRVKSFQGKENVFRFTKCQRNVNLDNHCFIFIDFVCVCGGGLSVRKEVATLLHIGQCVNLITPVVSLGVEMVVLGSSAHSSCFQAPLPGVHKIVYQHMLAIVKK